MGREPWENKKEKNETNNIYWEFGMNYTWNMYKQIMVLDIVWCVGCKCKSRIDETRHQAMEGEHFQSILLTNESTSPSAVRFQCSEEATGHNKVTQALVSLGIDVTYKLTMIDTGVLLMLVYETSEENERSAE